ncbi:methyltransferase domain-containing protein [Pseudonocardia zijingensis]|uniref:Methyltransferase domain-containing protein n=1 Tax=Pseudonocardia zijingensis TaxID=153376 RepID=A0ABN1QUG9_9PSEU
MTYALKLSEAERTRYRMMAELARSDEAEIWAAAGIRAGAAVADVGCGPGAVLRLLAHEVGAAGRADGVDQAPDVVAVAAAEVADLPQARVARGDAAATGLPLGEYDVAMCRHVLSHNGGREAAIVAHLRDLAGPGGIVYLVDVDFTALWINPPDPDLVELDARYRAYHDELGNDVTVGRSLGALLEGAGLVVEQFRFGGSVPRVPAGWRGPAWAAREALQAAGQASAEDLERWSAAFTRLDARADRPWVSIPLCVAVGRVPHRGDR